VESFADEYRTLDALTIRQRTHRAFSEQGYVVVVAA